MEPYYDHQHTFGPANPQLNNDGTQLFGSPPYYNHQHTFGPVTNGINNKGQQLFGIGAVTANSVTVGTLAGAGIIALYMIPSVIDILIAQKFFGFKTKLSTKQLTGRAAALGAVLGIPAAVIIGSGLATQG